MIISTVDELIKLAAIVTVHGKPKEDIIFSKELSYRIILKGDSWTPHVDYRVGIIAVKLQKVFDQIVKEVFDNNAPKELKEFIVKADISEGSLDYNAALRALEAFVKDMKDGTKLGLAFLAFALILGWRGIDATKEYKLEVLKQTKTIQSEKLASESQKMAYEITDKALNILDKSNSLNRTVVNMMDDKDTLKVPSGNLVLSKSQAKKILPKKNKIEPEWAYLDGTYNIVAIDLNHQTVEVSHDGEKFKSSFGQLSQNDKDKLKEAVASFFPTGDIPELSLQISAKFDRSGLTHSFINAIGKPRDGSTSRKEAENTFMASIKGK